MKKILIILMVLVLGTGLFGCGKGAQNAAETASGGQNTEAGSSPSASASSDSAVASPSASAAAESTAIWETDYYVDDFDQPTDQWYISNIRMFQGKFSNSATTDSKLYVQVLFDWENDISFMLYEYGNRQAKGPGYKDIIYDITMRTADGTDTSISGVLAAGGDRVFIDAEYVDQVLAALQGEGDISFYLLDTDRPTDEYLFTVEAGNFAQEYAANVG